ncbi:MAG: Do family serine endopeptidase [Parachlamydiales bacterium]|nr:Do family serine endopeptidase [Parachlamydiales bacterium]
MKRIVLIFLAYSTILFSPFTISAQDSTYLRETSKAFAYVGKKAIPAVVFIKAQMNGDINGSSNMEDYSDPFEYFHDEFYKRFFGQRGFGKKEPQYAAGSGCIVSKDGYILTNNHIVKDATSISITLNNGEEFDAKIIGTDPTTDLAIIKIEGNNFEFLEFANSDEIDIGEWVVAIGSPFQFQSSLTVGVVSAKRRQNLRITDLEDFIQTDAAINPGNSGGPLLDLDAKIVGINTALLSQNGGYMGICFAIPSNIAKHVMKQIIDNGSVKRGYLGITMQSIDKDMAEALELPNHEGVLIADVTKDSPADQAGLKQGDIILAYNNNAIKNFTSFRNEIALMEPNKTVNLTILRDGKKKEIKVKLGNFPETTSLSTKTSINLGIEVSDVKDVSSDILKKFQYSDSLEGVIITTVKQNSLALKSGLKPGMIIQQINNKKIKNIDDFNIAMKDADQKRHLLMLVRYQNITRFISVRLK